jgi:hypothetical protein
VPTLVFIRSRSMGVQFLGSYLQVKTKTSFDGCLVAVRTRLSETM